MVAAVVLAAILSVGIFLAMSILPGDVPTTILGKNATPPQVAAIEQEYHLNEPLPQRYATVDLGLRLRRSRPLVRRRAAGVESDAGARLQHASVRLIAILIMIPVAIALGVLSALKAGRATDHVVSNVSLLGISIPDFIVATLVVYAFGIVLGWFPRSRWSRPGASPLETPDILVLPVLTMLVIGAPFTSRMVRADMIEVMASDYVQTARLLGISERRIILRHALPNALGPAVQIIAATLLWLLGGVIAVEIVFNYPGIGAELVRGVQIRDINFVQSTALVLGVIFILINLWPTSWWCCLSPRLRSSLQ